MAAVRAIGGGQLGELWIGLSIAEVFGTTRGGPVALRSGVVVPFGCCVEEIESVSAMIAQCVAALGGRVAFVTGFVALVGAVIALVRVDIALVCDVIDLGVIVSSGSLLFEEERVVGDEVPVVARRRWGHGRAHVARITSTANPTASMINRSEERETPHPEPVQPSRSLATYQSHHRFAEVV